MNNEFLKMQKLAGLITESEFKANLNEMSEETLVSTLEENGFEVVPIPAWIVINDETGDEYVLYTESGDYTSYKLVGIFPEGVKIMGHGEDEWLEQFLETEKKTELNEVDNEELLDFVKSNSKEIAQAVGATNLKNISSDALGDISATPLFTDYEMVTTSSAPKATIKLNGETFSIQDVISNPSMFLNKKVVFQRNNDYNPENRTIGTIKDDRIGFNEKSKPMGSDISFSENPITDGEKSGDIKVGGKTIYYTMYNV